MKNERVNELLPEFLGIHAINSLACTVSSSRGFMFGSHFTQHLVTNGLEEKIILSGAEQELAKYTLGVRMPADGRIIKVIDKYPQGVGKDSLNLNPESLVIYYNEETKEVDCFTIPIYRSFHQCFGWKCVPGKGYEKLISGATMIEKGTVFVDTPGVVDGNSYMYGRNVNVAYMSLPAVSEDGLIISRSELQHWKYRVYETRIVEWGSSTFPVNIYGPNKPFPDIGEYIREDGLLMALRTYEPEIFVCDIGIHDVTKVDYTFDKQTYVSPGKGRIIDLEILSNNKKAKNIPIGMSEHADKYVRALVKYHREIVETEDQLRMESRRKYGVSNLTVSPVLNKILVRARAIINHGGDHIRQPLRLIHRKSYIDEYYAKFVVEYEITPDMGDKLTNHYGNKGVICKIMEDHQMPVRPDGVRADIIIAPDPIPHRMNLGQIYEQYFTCAAYDAVVRLTYMLGLIKSHNVDDFDARPEISPEFILGLNEDLFEESYEYLMNFYRFFNKTMPDYFSTLSREDKAEHLSDVINEGICRIFLPVNNERLFDDIVLDIEKFFKPTYTTVRYVDQSGTQVETVKKVRIGKVYMFLLDKPATEWSATSAARLQHHGILSSVTKSEKFAYPYRNSPVRILGETETRLMACYTGAKTVSEMIDRTNNPVARRNIYWNILNADQPGRIRNVVDRNEIPLGSSRPIQLFNHIAMCAGFRPTYLPEIIKVIQEGREHDREGD